MIAIAVAVVLAALLILRDVSARRRERVLVAEIASLRKQVTHTDRIANVGRLVSGLAQELKSPLQGMLGSAEVLAVSEPAAAGTSAQEVQDIRDNVTRAVGIVRNLLAFTETSALNRRWHDINDVVRRAIDHKRQDGGAADHIKLDDAPRLPLVYVDGRQIEKVIITILDHAIGHGAKAGRDIAIVTRRGTPVDERITVELDDPTLALPDDAPEWAGELHACRRVLEAHGGAFEIERRRAGGIRFRLELPVTEHVETQPK